MVNTALQQQRYIDAIAAAPEAIKKNHPRRWLTAHSLPVYIVLRGDQHPQSNQEFELMQAYKEVRKEVEALLPKHQSGEQLTTHRLLL